VSLSYIREDHCANNIIRLLHRRQKKKEKEKKKKKKKMKSNENEVHANQLIKKTK
jgi:hypothetical protein